MLGWFVPYEKVSGDFRAVTPKGQSVLIEVKYHQGKTFSLSHLAKHQKAALQRHHELNGVSLVIWVTDSNSYILRWPVPGLVKYKSITEPIAESLNLQFRDF